jgi:DNA-binding CsgD family transcriptional regulator
MFILQAAIALGHREAARTLGAQLACVAHLSTGDWVPTCLARHLGAAAALNGDRISARAYYAQALQSAGKIGFRPEMALTHLQLSELLLEEADGAGAIEHLDLAIPELEDMGMRPALERALALVPLANEQSAPRGSPLVASDSRTNGEPEVVEQEVAATSAPTSPLTQRQNEVALLVAQGLTNRQIAEQLVITERTAGAHIEHILDKLGFTSRTQIGVWVAGNVPADSTSR